MEHPGLVFEGMTIAGKAAGATEGILFLRGEYAYLRGALEAALARRRRDNLLGPDILGSGLTFDIRIFMGAGAYVCGEETALIECLEGFRGEPRNRPPFPASTGYLGLPSVVNNVETLAWAACILANGAAWFRGAGPSTGRKLFSVSGDCGKPGVYELPLGLTVAQLLAQADGAGAKAVQIGGAAGRCVPARDFGRAIAFEDSPTGGSVIVFGPQRDMLEVLRNFLEFFLDESCGQCTNRCPTGALHASDPTGEVWAALHDPGKHVVIQTAPSPRAAIGECFGLPPGQALTFELNTALRMCGFDRVFDTTFSADLTIMEEGTEWLLRLQAARSGRPAALPQFTSCCPGWVKYLEHFYPEYLPNLSSAKSPQQMFGAVIKACYARQHGIDPKDIVTGALMPCSAKKFECNRPDRWRGSRWRTCSSTPTSSRCAASTG